VLTTNGTYLWSFVTPIFRNQQICDLVHDNSIMTIAISMFVFYSTILMYSMVPGVIMLAVEQRNGSRVVFR
jgi:hypothetical protein